MATPFTLLLLSAAFLLRPAAADAGGRYNLNLAPRQTLDAGDAAATFSLGEKSAGGFKILQRVGDHILVGGRDAVYNVSAATLRLSDTIEWPASESDVSQCRVKGKSADECRNYVRVLAPIHKASTGGGNGGNMELLVCGTNAYRPMCRLYAHTPVTGGYQLLRQFDGYALAPYSPSAPATALVSHGSLYAGTVSDFAGADPLVYRRRLFGSVQEAGGQKQRGNGDELRSRRSEMTVLNDPSFVSSFSHGPYVYFFFRETPLEFGGGGGGGADRRGAPATYARVARVCKSDRGGPPPEYSDTWTSFVKARIVCGLDLNAQSSADVRPMHFDVLDAVSPLVRSRHGNDSLFYAAFSTGAPDGLRAGAVCAYRLSDVDRTFDTGSFLVREDMRHVWEAAAGSTVPKPRPGECVPDSRKMSAEAAAFARRRPLLADNVRPFSDQPLMVDNQMRWTITHLAVSPDKQSLSGHHFSYVFAGDSGGRVRKFVHDAATGGATLVDEYALFGDGEAVSSLLVTDSLALAASSGGRIASLPLSQCGAQDSCAGCVRLRDPLCAWHETRKACAQPDDQQQSWRATSDPTRYVQSLSAGRSARCPSGEFVAHDAYVVNGPPGAPMRDQARFGRRRLGGGEDNGGLLLADGDDGLDRLADSGDLVMAGSRQDAGYGRAVAFAVVITLVVASSVGFFLGYRVSRWKSGAKQQTKAAGSGASSTVSSCGDYSDRQSLTRSRGLSTNTTGTGGGVGGGGGPTMATHAVLVPMASNNNELGYVPAERAVLSPLLASKVPSERNLYARPPSLDDSPYKERCCEPLAPTPQKLSRAPSTKLPPAPPAVYLTPTRRHQQQQRAYGSSAALPVCVPAVPPAHCTLTPQRRLTAAQRVTVDGGGMDECDSAACAMSRSAVGHAQVFGRHQQPALPPQQLAGGPWRRNDRFWSVAANGTLPRDYKVKKVYV